MIRQKEHKKWPGLSAGMIKGSITVSGLLDSTGALQPLIVWIAACAAYSAGPLDTSTCH